MELIVVLDYETGFTHIMNKPDWLNENDEIEDYLQDGLGFHLSSVDWMISKGIKMDIA